MTYCIGWITQTASFLVTDSAVTYTSKNKKYESYNKTSFGELQGDVHSGKRFVYEEAFKVFTFGNIAITFAGDTSFGYELISLIREHLKFESSVRKAIRNLVNNFQDFSSYEKVHLLVACYDKKPLIFSIDNKSEDPIVIIDKYITIGSAPADLEEYSNSFFGSFYENYLKEKYTKFADEVFLLKMLALVQSYGIHNYTIENGIGGAYSGVYVNQDSLRWQPDICYSIQGIDPTHEAKMFTAILIRNNCKCIVSTESYNIVQSHSTDSNGIENAESALSCAMDTFDKGEFDYIVFINATRHTATIVHMKKKLSHELLVVDVHEDKKGTIGLLIDAELNNIINDHHKKITTKKYATIKHIPFIPIHVDKYNQIQKSLKETRITKVYNKNPIEYKGIIYDSKNEIKEWFYIKQPEDVLCFIKYHEKESKIHIVSCSTDMIELEYCAGAVVFPKIPESELVQIFSEINDKTTPKNLYLFDLMINIDSDSAVQQYTIKVLCDNWKDAEKLAKIQVKQEIGELFKLTPVGIEFYYPARNILVNDGFDQIK